MALLLRVYSPPYPSKDSKTMNVTEGLLEYILLNIVNTFLVKPIGIHRNSRKLESILIFTLEDNGLSPPLFLTYDELCHFINFVYWILYRKTIGQKILYKSTIQFQVVQHKKKQYTKNSIDPLHSTLNRRMHFPLNIANNNMTSHNNIAWGCNNSIYWK